MKILIVNYRYFVSGGPERYMFNLKSLLESKGHQVVPFSIRYSKNEPTEFAEYFVPPLSSEDEVYFKEQSWTLTSVKRSLERSFYSREVFDNLSRLIEREKPDFAVVLHFLRKLSPAVLHALQAHHIPHIVRISDFALICPQAHLFRDNAICEKCVNGPLYQSVLHGCVQNSKSVSLINYLSISMQRMSGVFKRVPFYAIPSRFTRSKFVEAGWQPQRLVHLPTFVTHTDESLNRTRKKQIVYIGRVEYLKGVHVLLQAMAYLKKEKSYTVSLKIVGEDISGVSETHREFVRREGLTQIEFLGFLGKTEILETLRTSYASVVPSIAYDNMPNSALESLSVGTPVIASSHGSFSEIVLDGKNGYLFEPMNYIHLAEKLHAILEDDGTREAMSEQALAFIADHHSAERHYATLMSLYERQTAIRSYAAAQPARDAGTPAKLNVLLVNTFHYLRGGDCTYTFALKRILQDRGHKVIDFAMTHPLNVPSEFEDYFADYIDFRDMNARKSLWSGVQVLNRSIFSRHAKKKIAALMDDHPPDVAHIQNFHGHLTPSVLTELNRRRIPVAMTIHDYKMLCPNTHFLSHGVICEACKGGKFYECAVRRCKKESALASVVASLEAYIHHFLNIAQYVDYLIAPSEFLRDKFIEYGWDKEKIHVHNNFLVDEQFDNTPQPVEDYLLFVGQIETWKGISTLVHAAGRLSGLLKIKLAGSGSMLEEFKAGYQNHQNLEFIGHQSRADLKTLTQRAYCVIQPSAWYENYPYSIMEAMALRKPVIAARIGGLPELVEHGKNGLLFESGNFNDMLEKIEALPTKDSAEYQQMCDTSFAMARQKFDSTDYYNSIINVYQKLMEK